MISTSKIINNKILIKYVLGLFLILLPFKIFAQDSLTLSVSPTLFDMSAAPNQEWPSIIRVINSNPYEISIYIDTVNFAPQGEAGQGKFLPVINNQAEGNTIAEWIQIDKNEIIIPAEKTIEVPFTIKVPNDATPGGHFAAILVGTKPPREEENTSQVQTAQVVTTLVFLRVAGDVNESGNIRSFRTTESILESPEANFELRFENKGNVHILPQGEIKILNMWGQERGVIPINRETLFGNVLPNSVRKYDFTWKGEWSIADIGRYQAIATLAYGNEQRQFADSEAFFWVIPWKILGSIILVIGAFIYFFTWAIKAYVRKMLSMSGLQPGYKIVEPKSTAITKRKKMSLVAPLEAGMLDLRGRLEGSTSILEKFITLTSFVGNYKKFFIAILGILLFVTIVFLYVRSASVKERAYEVTIDGLSSEVTISSEEVAYQKLENQESDTKPNLNSSLPKIIVVNRSGVTGLAASAKLKLETEGYEVIDISNDFGVDEDKTIIVYPPDLAEKALALSKILGYALLSSYSEEGEVKNEITVYAGKDLIDVVQ
jgi:LytR cell envelope-related transcriptional attenuator